MAIYIYIYICIYIPFKVPHTGPLPQLQAGRAPGKEPAPSGPGARLMVRNPMQGGLDQKYLPSS